MPLELSIDYDQGTPVYRQIYEAVLTALATGRLQKDEQLPTIHQLARRLEVNPNTVARAYRELESDGYVSTQRGRGTFPKARRETKVDRAAAIKKVVQRALADSARHGISGEELVGYLGKVLA